MERSRSLPIIPRSTNNEAKDKDERRSEISGATHQRRSRNSLDESTAKAINILKHRRTLAGATLRRKITYLNRLLEESKDISVLEKQRDELDLLRERVNEAHDNYYSKLTTFEEINEAYQWFDIRDREYFQSRTRINERINSFEQTKAYDYVLQRSTLTQSSNSSKSPQNSTSSIRSRRAKAAAKAASLQIEMNFIDQETEYKKQQMLYESEYKRQQMLKEYAKAKAEEETMKKFEQEITNRETISQRQSNDMQAYFDRNTYGVGSAHPMHRCRDKERRPEELGTRNLIQSDDDISDVSGSWPDMPNEDDRLPMKTHLYIVSRQVKMVKSIVRLRQTFLI